MQRVKLTLSGELEAIPKGDGYEFVEWCESKGFRPINGFRRAWCSSLSTYLRDADYLFHLDGGDTVMLTHGEILAQSVIVDKDERQETP